MVAKPRADGDLQDGMLAYYLSQVKASDVNVEARIEKEPFDFKDHIGARKRPAGVTAGRKHVTRAP